MEPLKGSESLYLHLESDGMPMHVSSLTIYDPATAPGGNVEFRDIQRFFADRAYRSPIFQRRLASLPLGLARPYWITDPGFDIEFHLRHLALPKPGGWRELTTQVARLHARPLDRSRPLWECYLIEEIDRIPGLPRGSFAIFLKTHCAALGRTLGTQLFAAIHELAPESAASPPKRVRYFDRSPTVADLALRSAIDAGRRPLDVARYVVAHGGPLLTFGGMQLRNAADSVRRALGGTHEEDAPRVPRTRFNGKVSPHRVVEGVRFDLAAIERIRDAVPHATVNDVALALIGGALRRYLEGRLDLPAASLVAQAPTTSRSETRIFGARSFADSALVTLATDVDDPLERLRRIVAATREQNAHFSVFLGRRMLLDALELVPDAVIGTLGEGAQRMRLGSRIAPIANTTVESVRGPDVPLFLAGARLIGFYGLASVHDLAGLAHIVGYFGSDVTISVTACRTMLPDPARYAQALRDAYDDLARAAGLLPPQRSVPVALPATRGKQASRIAQPVAAQAPAPGPPAA
jgi:WS/DGAT/MGAT family acyltransferase